MCARVRECVEKQISECCADRVRTLVRYEFVTIGGPKEHFMDLTSALLYVLCVAPELVESG